MLPRQSFLIPMDILWFRFWVAWRSVILMQMRQRVLIVDDAKLNRDILKEILGETYNYLEAENGNQAVQMLGENIGIDLMFLG